MVAKLLLWQVRGRPLRFDPTKRGIPMPLFDVLGLIPQGLQRQIVDSVVDFVSEQAEKYLGNQVADKLKNLRSDAAFRRKP
jgi:hypothetical protein